MLTISTDPTIFDPEDGTLTVADPGYRVLLIHDDGQRFMVASRRDGWAFRFARKRDAEAAIAALERAGLTTFETMRDAGWIKLREVMLEAMQW